MDIHVRDPRLTGRQAAEKFATECFDEPRKVGKWRDGKFFRLAGGRQWYEIIALPNGGGWRIVAEISPA